MRSKFVSACDNAEAAFGALLTVLDPIAIASERSKPLRQGPEKFMEALMLRLVTVGVWGATYNSRGTILLQDACKLPIRRYETSQKNATTANY